MTSNKTAPVVLFTYDRPQHVLKTLEALRNNVLADNTKLYIFSDGPKQGASADQIARIEETRRIIKSGKWCAEVFITESQNNKGLAKSIIEGVNEVVKQHGKVIVLEDDLVTSRFFLQYMNKALEFYDDYPAVFSVAAYGPSGSGFNLPSNYQYDAYISLRPYSKGWGTWKEKWERVDWSMDFTLAFFANNPQVEAFKRGGEDLLQLLKMQCSGDIDSWAIRFAFAHFRQHAVAVLPVQQYLNDIGFDALGTHTKNTAGPPIANFSRCTSTPAFPDILYEDSRIINSMYSFFLWKKRPLWKKAINRLSRIFGGHNIFKLKGRVYSKV